MHRSSFDDDLTLVVLLILALFFFTGCGAGSTGWWDYSLMRTDESTEGRIISWRPDQLPILVSTYKARGAARMAVDTLNDLVGVQFFEYVDAHDSNLVWVSAEAFEDVADGDSGTVGFAHVDYDKQLHYMDGWYVLLNEKMSGQGEESQAALMAHELGHVLGFGHDNTEDCILMSPILCGDAEKRIGDRQLDLFRQVYAAP